MKRLALLFFAVATFALAAEPGGLPSLTLLETEKGLNQPDQPPVWVTMRRPAYPFEMRRKGIAGEVDVEFTVDAKGRVKDAKVVRTPDRAFERSATAAIELSTFKPGMKEGKPVAVRMRVTLIYQLQPQR